MDRDTLRELQAPLKERYRSSPADALVTLHADGALGEGVACSVSTHAALVDAGLHPATGGDGSQVCSGDMLLQALVACAGVTLRSVATALEVPVSGHVRAEGDLDFRGTLGVDKTAPVGFTAIRLLFDVEGVPDDKRDKLLELTLRYCVVYQTLATGMSLSGTYA